MSRSTPPIRWGGTGLGAVLLMLFAAGPGAAQVEVLPADLVTRLAADKEKPLLLVPAGDPAPFVAPGATWTEAAPPVLLDLDRDGVLDFIVLLLVEEQTSARGLIIHEWAGGAPDAFGKAVFYVILTETGEVTEWAGTHRLNPAAAPAGASVPAPKP